MILEINQDAFSSGQIGSKLWLCQELERLFDHIDSVWIYGGWYGLTSFLLKTRGVLKVNQIKSFDIDESCEIVADMINENWVWQNWQFKAETVDCNQLQPKESNPDLIINTSTEHFQSTDWWDKIPKGTCVALQGNNMPHEDHFVHSKSLEEFAALYPLSTTLFQGQKEFVYPDWSFIRYMIIGIK